MVLQNKLNITNSYELSKEEERLTKLRALELFDSDVLNEAPAGSFSNLADIHKQLFQDIYDFAGEVRNEDISKGGFRFASVLYLDDSIKKVEKMPQSNFDEIVRKYVEMNVVHPFREGNGRSMRIWLDNILKSEIGKVVDWSNINTDDYLLAMERSPIKDLEIKTLLKEALTDQVDDREVYMKGVDASYSYEGYETYNMADLDFKE